jgi:hypothetical protein
MEDDKYECSGCNGTGIYWAEGDDYSCPICQTNNEKCSVCNGTKLAYVDHEYQECYECCICYNCEQYESDCSCPQPCQLCIGAGCIFYHENGDVERCPHCVLLDDWSIPFRP